MVKCKENVEVIGGMVGTPQLKKLFRRSGLTLLKWRKRRGLPYVRIKGTGKDAIRYRLDKVREWANRTARKTYEKVR